MIYFFKKIWSKVFGPTVRGLSESDIKKLVSLAIKNKRRCSSGFTLKIGYTHQGFYHKESMNLLGQYLKNSKSFWAVIKDGYLIFDFEMKKVKIFGDKFEDGDEATLKIYLEGVENDFFRKEKRWKKIILLEK